MKIPIPHFASSARFHEIFPRSTPVTSPLEGSEWGLVEPATAETADRVVQSAQVAFGEWSTVPNKDRTQPLFRFKQLVEPPIEELSALVTQEDGKTLEEAEAGILPQAQTSP